MGILAKFQRGTPPPSDFYDNTIDDIVQSDDYSYSESLSDTYALRLSQVRWVGTQLRAACALYDTDANRIVLLTDLDLINLTDRERLIRQFQTFESNDSNNDDPSWASVVHTLFAEVVHHEKRSDQPIVITSAPKRTNDRYVTVGAMPLLADDFTMVFGDGGSKKSLMALWWAAQVSKTGTRVLWLDYEMCITDHKERLETLFPGRAFPNLFHMIGAGPVAQMEDVLRQHIKALGVTFLVVDSAIAASPGRNGAPADMPTEFFQTLRRLKVGVLIIGHQTKSADDTKPFGSVFWHNSVRASWFVKSTNDAVVLVYRKDSHGGGPFKKGDKLAYSVIRDAKDHTHITPKAIKLTIEDKIIKVLSEFAAGQRKSACPRTDGYVAISDVRTAIKDEKRDSLNKTLKRLLTKGVIDTDRRERYVRMR